MRLNRCAACVCVRASKLRERFNFKFSSKFLICCTPRGASEPETMTIELSKIETFDNLIYIFTLSICEAHQLLRGSCDRDAQILFNFEIRFSNANK